MRVRKKLLASPLAWAALAMACATGLSLNRANAAASAESSASHGAPSAIRRLTEAQYRNTIADIFGADIKVVGRFEPDLRVEGLVAVGSSAVSVGPAGFEQYEGIARNIAAQVMEEPYRTRIMGCTPGPDAQGTICARDFIERLGLRLFRRPLPAGEADAWVAIANNAGVMLGNHDAGLAAALAGMLSDPRFLFRIDVPGKGGRTVDGYSRAARLSYLMWNSTPDQALLDAAANGALDTPQGLAAEIDRLITSPRFTSGVRAFFTDYLLLDDMETLSKDSLIFPAYSATVAGAMREQTLRTITDHVVDRNGDYRDLFVSRRFAMTYVLGPIYDIPVRRDGWYFHEFPQDDPRSGLLSHASLLALHSHPGRTSPTLRGMAISEVFLCEKIPQPPANVNFAVVQDVNNPTLKTTRARLQAHLDDEECATCHKRTDPVGLGLEQFDGVGTFRTMENGEPIDVASEFNKIAFNGAASLGEQFRNSQSVSDCLVRSVWRYANARNPVPADEQWLMRMTGGFNQDGHRIPALFRALANDPSFYALGPARPAKRQIAWNQTGDIR